MLTRPTPSARRLGGIVAGLILIAAIAGMVWRQAPSEPPVSADIYVNAELLKALAGLDDDFNFDLAREAGYITGPIVLGAALKRPEMARLDIVKRQGTAACGWVARLIRVEFPGPNLLRVRYVGERSFDAARLVNSIAAAYIDQMVNESGRLRGERINLLERAQRDTAIRLEEKRNAIGRLEQMLAAGDPAAGPEKVSRGERIGIWARELAALRKGVEQGEEMVSRITAELARLKLEPKGTAIELHRAAEL